MSLTLAAASLSAFSPATFGASALEAIGSRLDHVALNPQPLPPRETALHGARSFDHVALNPQPLPPGDALSFATRLGLMADDFCGTVPHKLPVPPSPGPQR